MKERKTKMTRVRYADVVIRGLLVDAGKRSYSEIDCQGTSYCFDYKGTNDARISCLGRDPCIERP